MVEVDSLFKITEVEQNSDLVGKGKGGFWKVSKNEIVQDRECRAQVEFGPC